MRTINPYMLLDLGLHKLAASLFQMLSLGSDIDSSQTVRLVKLVEQELRENQTRFEKKLIGLPLCSRVRYTILCGLHVLLDEFSLTQDAKDILSEFLGRPECVIPEYLDGVLPNGCIVSCRMTDYVQFMTWFYGVYEPIEAYLFASLVRPGMVVIDAGANIGQYTLLAATKVGPHGVVHSFEPLPQNLAELLSNVESNRLSDYCQGNESALWNCNGALVLRPPAAQCLRRYRTNNGAYHVTDSPTADYGRNIWVSCRRLDSYLQQAGVPRLDLVKIDVEGAELRVLQGGESAIREWKPAIFMEINENALAAQGCRAADLFALLKNWEYEYLALEDAAPAHDFNRGHGNFLFYQKDQSPSLRAAWRPEDAFRWAVSGYAATSRAT